MSYRDRHPTFSFRIEPLEKSKLEKLAKLEKISTNEFARKIITMYLKNELVKKTEDLQTEKIKLQIEKLKLENEYLRIKCNFADNFHAPISQSASHYLKPKGNRYGIDFDGLKSEQKMIINETQTEEFQSPYDASNHRLQFADCGILFCWYSEDEFNSQMQKFQRHLSEDHMRKMNETEKEVMTYLEYEANST